MTPADALNRIAELLEAEDAETYRVRSFRRAAATVAKLTESELAELSTRGALKTLPGVGDRTASVIAEVLAGGVPTYLRDLEERAPGELEGRAGEIFRALRGDCHSHSEWSDGSTPIEEMAETALQLGHEYQALTDHSPRLTVAHGLSAEDLRRQIALVEDINLRLAPFRLLTGIEVDILEDGALDQEHGLLERLDVVVASVHSKLRMESAPMTRRMVAAVEDPNVDILGHCTGRKVVGRGRPQSTFDHEAVFSACAASGTAVEINSRPDRLDPPEELIRLALSLGCRFSIDSDAHAPGQLSWLRFGSILAAEAGVPVDAIVNTMGLEEFTAWTAGHGR
jgi:putative hydrolase